MNEETRLNENDDTTYNNNKIEGNTGHHTEESSIGIDRVAKQQLGRKTFLFKADADAAKKEQLTER